MSQRSFHSRRSCYADVVRFWASAPRTVNENGRLRLGVAQKLLQQVNGVRLLASNRLRAVWSAFVEGNNHEGSIPFTREARHQSRTRVGALEFRFTGYGFVRTTGQNVVARGKLEGFRTSPLSRNGSSSRTLFTVRKCSSALRRRRP